jgi:hypothetical protein
MEQKAAIKISVILKKTATETFEMLKTVHGEECLSRTNLVQWHKRYIEAQKVGMQKSRVKTMLTVFFMLKVLYNVDGYSGTPTCHVSGYPRQVIKVATLLRQLRFILTALPTVITHNNYTTRHL